MPEPNPTNFSRGGTQAGGPVGASGVTHADEAARRAFTLLSATVGNGRGFLMTARHESARRGLVVQRVMTCADAPMSVCVSLPKGHPISPLVRDSRGFALCAIDPSDRVLPRLFEPRRHAPGAEAGPLGGAQGGTMSGSVASGNGSAYAPGGAGGGIPAESDPFISLELESMHSGAPLVKRCLFALDLRVSMHLDFESDHEMYIGVVVGGREYAPAAKSEKRKTKNEK